MDRESRDSVVVATGSIVLALAVWWAFSALEAHFYWKVTGKRVSSTSAMFLDLRVQEGARVEKGEGAPVLVEGGE